MYDIRRHGRRCRPAKNTHKQTARRDPGGAFFIFARVYMERPRVILSQAYILAVTGFYAFLI